MDRGDQCTINLRYHNFNEEVNTTPPTEYSEVTNAPMEQSGYTEPANDTVLQIQESAPVSSKPVESTKYSNSETRLYL